MSIHENSISIVKSSLDKWGLDIAKTGLGNNAVALDLDDQVSVGQKLAEGHENALVWKMMDFSTTHLKGVHNLAFAMGSAVQEDANNMLAMSLAGTVQDYFCSGKSYPVNNFIGATAPYPEVGRFNVRTVDMNPQVADSLTGYRLVVVEGLFFYHPAYAP